MPFENSLLSGMIVLVKADGCTKSGQQRKGFRMGWIIVFRYGTNLLMNTGCTFQEELLLNL